MRWVELLLPVTYKWGRKSWVESDGMVGETPSQARKQVTALDAVVLLQPSINAIYVPLQCLPHRMAEWNHSSFILSVYGETIAPASQCGSLCRGPELD